MGTPFAVLEPAGATTAPDKTRRGMVNSKSSAVGEPEWGAVKDLVRTAVSSELSRPQGLATSPHALRQAVGSFGAPARQLTPFSGEPRVVGSRRTAGSFGARARQVTPFEKGIAGRTSTGARVATPFPDSGVAGDWQYVALFHHPVQAVRGSFSGMLLWSVAGSAGQPEGVAPGRGGRRDSGDARWSIPPRGNVRGRWLD